MSKKEILRDPQGRILLADLPDGLPIDGCKLEGLSGGYHYEYEDVTLERRGKMVIVTIDESKITERTKRIRASNVSWTVTLPSLEAQ